MVVPVELKLRYLSRRSQELHALRESLEAGDFAPALKLGHQVKGNAATFEFPQLASLALEFERAARNEDKAELLELLKKLESEIHSAQGKTLS